MSFRLHRFTFQVHRDQTCYLGPAQSGELLHIAPHHTPATPLQILVTLLTQRLVHPVINLLSISAFEPDCFLLISIANLAFPDWLYAQIGLIIPPVFVLV